jgi:hypothetical protein
LRIPSILEAQPASVATEDRQFYVSFGLVLSTRLADLDKIRAAIESLGGKIIFHTVSDGRLYLLREYQVERAIHGDVSHLKELHDRKKGGTEKNE